jgi:hypothetical protein
MSVMCEDVDDMPNGEGVYGEAAAYIDPTPRYYGCDGDWHFFGGPGFYGGLLKDRARVHPFAGNGGFWREAAVRGLGSPGLRGFAVAPRCNTFATRWT